MKIDIKDIIKIMFSTLFFGLAILVATFPWAKESIDNKVIFFNNYGIFTVDYKLY